MNEARLQKLLEFFEKDPSDPFLRYALATEYLKLKEYPTALVYFEDLVKDHPKYIATYYHLGKLYETLGRREDAIQIYQQGMNVARGANDSHAFTELRAAFLSVTGNDFDED